MALKFTDENFQKQVLESEILVLVDFYADWCGPCKMMSPVIEELAEQYQDTVKIGKINVDEEPNTAQEYKVMTIPTLLFIKEGKVLETIIGVVSKSSLSEKIDLYK
ncbi:MAG TPA: thioredoxin [Clostridiales bacterium]|nr:thioredoxin [Clostridiales bacterium]